MQHVMVRRVGDTLPRYFQPLIGGRRAPHIARKHWAPPAGTPRQALPRTRLSLSESVIRQEVDVLLRHSWQERRRVLRSQLGSRWIDTRGTAETIAGFYFEKRPKLFGLKAVRDGASLWNLFSTSRGPEDPTRLGLQHPSHNAPSLLSSLLILPNAHSALCQEWRCFKKKRRLRRREQ